MFFVISLEDTFVLVALIRYLKHILHRLDKIFLECHRNATESMTVGP